MFYAAGLDNKIGVELTIDTLKTCKSNGQIEKAIIEIQKFISSETGRSELESMLWGSVADKKLADEFNSL